MQIFYGFSPVFRTYFDVEEVKKLTFANNIYIDTRTTLCKRE